ncbi:hypothetical protein AQUSIP_19890 [Aquicella siphonis]|uniref:Uncharacterized protein n=1 Tax=Aquicella siphonis TaxID=254247 RepID=A0A5E4PJB8_9COXI|nr:HAD family hydrolase [Aquicella siphonis]VVC76665.1 hypothetical protein AQUSIP_19890 [Aquicella siphonis]
MAVVTKQMAYGPEHSPNRIRANDLAALPDRCHTPIDTLSLDCFDTLLWRKYASPHDVFYQLQHAASFQSLGMTAAMRIQAEDRARRLMLLNQQHSEVRLRDIYLANHPELDKRQLDALSEEEIAAEMEACFAYPPMVQLIRDAQSRGMKIIIVSDTYFEEPQLRRLLTAALPADVMAAIDSIYCSCDYGKSKATGLFEKIVRSRGNTPENYLHIGDHAASDYAAPRAFRLNALQFQREDEYMTNLLRLQAIAAGMMDTGTRSTRPVPSPFLGVFAMEKTAENKPESLIGYASLGPIMYTFARYICDEIEQMRREGKQPKALFLMRDAYLPSLACSALTRSTLGACVSISRFAAYAASFRSQREIDRYLAESAHSQRFRDMARQLLLPDKVAEPLIRTAHRHAQPEIEFARLVRRRDILRMILDKSAQYRSRLLRHLQKTAGIAAKDTLVFIDLGYHGTVQDLLTPVFADMNIEVTGRYLITLRTPGWESRRRGLLDPSWCDDKALQTLVSYIALLEQLCTSNQGSVVDYDREGSAVHAVAAISAQQHAKLFQIQSECLRFIHDAQRYFQDIKPHISPFLLRETVRAELCRMIFFPTAPELQYLRSFQFDWNLGTQDVSTVFDPEQGLKGLHRRGLFFIEKNSKTMRMNYPAELRAAGFELTLALLSQQRFGLDIKLKDMLPRQSHLPATLARGHETHQTILDAQMTYDGYYTAWTPVGEGDIQVSVLWGKKHEWIQIESAELIQMDAFIAQNESQHTHDAWPCLAFDQMTEHRGRLFHCTSGTSSMTLKPSLQPEPGRQYVFRIVYRPLAPPAPEPAAVMQGPKITFTF